MQKRLVRKARERNGNDDGNREAQEPPLAVERSHGRRQRWEYQAGSIGMHHSSRAGSGGPVQGSADRCISRPCHPPLSKIYAGILGLHCKVCPKRCPLVFPSLPLVFSITAPPHPSCFSYHFCRPWRDSQVSINKCLKAP